MQSTSQIQTDFDRLAAFSTDGWDHNSHYHDFLLRQLPSHIESALDLGCGTGAFSRRLAERCNRVIGIDLSPQMIQFARERSSKYLNIQFEIADVMTQDIGHERFDCITSIATLHHLPFDERGSSTQ
jgi:2-polyprenyl-3-methyl-5-hydroxy-6-metoxy-1,4-benzoquinol methylase